MRFIDEQNDGLGRGLDFVDHLTQPVLELAFHARAGLQQADIQRAQRHVLQDRRNVAINDAPREPFHDGGLADAGLAGQDRIVLPPAHQDVDNLPDFGIAADNALDLPHSRPLR